MPEIELDRYSLCAGSRGLRSSNDSLAVQYVVKGEATAHDAILTERATSLARL